MDPADLLMNRREIVYSSHLALWPTVVVSQTALVHHVLEQIFVQAMTDRAMETHIVASESFENRASNAQTVGVFVTERVQQARNRAV